MAGDNSSDGTESKSVVANIFQPNDASWTHLRESREARAFSAAWLDIQSRLLDVDMRCGVVVLGTPDEGPFAPTAIWPAGSLGSPVLAEAIETAISKRQSTIKNSKRISTERAPRSHALACPLLVDGQICGAVAIEVDHVPEVKLKKLMEQLEWGAGWMEVNVHRNKYTSSDRLVTVLELIATSLHHDRFQASATAVATELASLLKCERVAIGFLRRNHTNCTHNSAFTLREPRNCGRLLSRCSLSRIRNVVATYDYRLRKSQYNHAKFL